MVSMTVRPSLTETSLMSVSGFLQFSSGSYTAVRFRPHRGGGGLRVQQRAEVAPRPGLGLSPELGIQLM